MISAASQESEQHREGILAWCDLGAASGVLVRMLHRAGDEPLVAGEQHLESLAGRQGLDVVHDRRLRPGAAGRAA